MYLCAFAFDIYRPPFERVFTGALLFVISSNSKLAKRGMIALGIT